MTKDEILSKTPANKDWPREPVEIPEWSGTVWVKVMTGTERDAWEASCIGHGGSPNLVNMRARLVCVCLVDENGETVFGPKDVPEIGRIDSRILDRLFDAARALNGLTKEDVVEIEGNSSAA